MKRVREEAKRMREQDIPSEELDPDVPPGTGDGQVFLSSIAISTQPLLARGSLVIVSLL